MAMSELDIPVAFTGDFAIVKVHPHMIAYVDGLQRKNAEALSFYPKCVFERESEKGRIFLGLLNGEPCGYLQWGSERNAMTTEKRRHSRNDRRSTTVDVQPV